MKQGAYTKEALSSFEGFLGIIVMMYLQRFRELYAVLEGKNDSAVGVDVHMVYQRIPCSFLENHRQFVQLAQLEKETAQNVALQFMHLPLHTQAVQPIHILDVAFNIIVVSVSVIRLVKRRGGVCIDQLLYQTGKHIYLAGDFTDFLVNAAEISKCHA